MGRVHKILLNAAVCKLVKSVNGFCKSRPRCA